MIWVTICTALMSSLRPVTPFSVSWVCPIAHLRGSLSLTSWALGVERRDFGRSLRPHHSPPSRPAALGRRGRILHIADDGHLPQVALTVSSVQRRPPVPSPILLCSRIAGSPYQSSGKEDKLSGLWPPSFRQRLLRVPLSSRCCRVYSSLWCFRHSQGGTGYGSCQRPRLLALATPSSSHRCSS